MSDKTEAGRKSAWQALRPAIKSALPLTLIGLVLGIAFNGLWFYLSGGKTTGVVDILKYLGWGFIIAAIIDVFFEWRFHIRGTPQLTEQIEGILKAGNESAEAFFSRALVRGAGAAPPYVKDTISNLKLLLQALADLSAEELWAKEQYMAMAGSLIGDLRNNIESLRKLNDPGDVSFTLAPFGGDLAGAILVAQVRALCKGDAYEVISTLSSWKGQRLRDLHEEERTAIQLRGAIVRRLFNLTGIYRNEVSETEVREILLRHLNDARTWGPNEKQLNYELRVIGARELDLSNSTFLHDNIEKAHFGIFKHGSEKVRVKVERSDLLDMLMSKDPAIIKSDNDLFMEAWKAAIELTEENLDPIVKSLHEPAPPQPPLLV